LPRLHRSNVTNPLTNPGSERNTKILRAQNKKIKRKRRAVFCHPALPYPHPTLPSPRSSRQRPPPPPEAAPPSPHDLCSQRNAAASIHAAARGSAQAGTPPLLRSSACAPSRPRDPLYHTPRGVTAGKKQKNSSSQMMVPQRVTSRVLEGFPILPRHVCGPHLSSDASLPAALRCERYEVDAKGRIVPGYCPIMATRRRANRDSMF